MVFCKNRNDFYIEIPEKISYIREIIFINANTILAIQKDMPLLFPFENCNLNLNEEFAIISTMCKDYSSRLEEWIEYNLNLGFSGIVIFDNDENKINESLIYQQNKVTTRDICKKYKDKVFCVKFSYKPIRGHHWNTIQRISLHICVNAFRNRCEN